MSYNRQSLKNIIAKICVNLGLLHFQLRKLKNDVLILTYHKVTDNYDPVGLSVAPRLFGEQILTLKKYFDIITLNEALDFIGGKICRNIPAIAITFDDGYADNYENVFPIIQEQNVPITIFLTTGCISHNPLYWEKINSVILNKELLQVNLLKWGGDVYFLNNELQRLDTLNKISSLIKSKPCGLAEEIIDYLVGLDGGVDYNIAEMMTWNQVREMQESSLVTFGSHTVSHHILSRMSKPEVEKELIDSRYHIEDELGIIPSYLAYPNGGVEDYDLDVEKIALQIGYKAAFSMMPGSVRGSRQYALPRIDVTPNMSCNGDGQYVPELFLSKIVGIF